MKDHSILKLKAKVQKVFNKFIRSRDSEDGYFICISCNVRKSISQMNAGHYYPAGQYQSLRYNEHNVNGECIQCNFYGGDHLITYGHNLRKKIGNDAVDQLDLIASVEKNKGHHKLDRMTLMVKLSIYKDKLKAING